MVLPGLFPIRSGVISAYRLSRSGSQTGRRVVEVLKAVARGSFKPATVWEQHPRPTIKDPITHLTTGTGSQIQYSSHDISVYTAL